MVGMAKTGEQRMKHIDWKLQHCLHKPTRWIEEKTEKTEEIEETEHEVIKGNGREKHEFSKRTGE